jgi:hypothetical protein
VRLGHPERVLALRCHVGGQPFREQAAADEARHPQLVLDYEHARAALITRDGTIGESRQTPTLAEQGASAVCDRIASEVQALLDIARERGEAITHPPVDTIDGYLTKPEGNGSFPAIVQEYVPGEEYGVFYYRYPGGERGRVFSVTEKRMPVLLGDGKCTLEELILADDRAVCMSDFYLRKNSDRTHKVPAAGESVQLVEIGTHCRGAIFLDGCETITPDLEEVIDRIAKTFDGFFFGRFDIRVPSRQDFMAGRNIKIIELNGVTSEATHMYDPKLSLFEAYRVLFRQWRIAFEIGHINRAQGIRPASVGELLGAARRYSHLAQSYPE